MTVSVLVSLTLLGCGGGDESVDSSESAAADDDGGVDESQIPEEGLIGEIEEFPSGAQRSATFELDAGTYVLFCNITETEADGTIESHFANGMSTTFTVE